MLKPMQKLAVWGFLFGAVGLFPLAILSMMNTVLETVFAPLFFPGRVLSEALVGPNGSDIAVFMLSLCNGILYAGIFMAVGLIIKPLLLSRQKK